MTQFKTKRELKEWIKWIYTQENKEELLDVFCNHLSLLLRQNEN